MCLWQKKKKKKPPSNETLEKLSEAALCLYTQHLIKGALCIFRGSSASFLRLNKQQVF